MVSNLVDITYSPVLPVFGLLKMQEGNKETNPRKHRDKKHSIFHRFYIMSLPPPPYSIFIELVHIETTSYLLEVFLSSETDNAGKLTIACSDDFGQHS